MPEPRYGAAAVALVADGLFPLWALFAFPELKRRAHGATTPEILCLRCDDAIILAPNIDGQNLSGMLIALRSASDSIREMFTPDGKMVLVRLPRILDRVVAIEEPELRALV